MFRYRLYGHGEDGRVSEVYEGYVHPANIGR